MRNATSFLKARPIGLRDAFRLYSALVIALAVKLLSPRRFRPVGYWILGKGVLTISAYGVLATVRPKTSDISTFLGSQEPLTMTWFKVGDGDLVIDVGAHIGRYALVAAKKARKVIAIEPEPSNFSMLKKNAELNAFSNILLRRTALGDRPGRILLHTGDEISGDTSTSSIDDRLAGRGPSIEVEQETLDGLMTSLGTDSVDWIKIDVELYEVKVLEGAIQTLAKTNNLIIEVANDHRTRCLELTKTAGLELVAVEKETGRSVENWYMTRRLPSRALTLSTN